jgi:lysophospholipase L1-like esterase
MVGVFGAIAIAELSARLFTHPDPVAEYAAKRGQHNREMRGRFYEFDPDLGWKHRPGASGPFVAPDFSSTVHISSTGFRATPRPVPERPNGAVWILGDSVAFGYGVDDDQNFSALLASAHPELVVENLAVSGFGTDQELLLLKRELARRGQPSVPTAVVATFYLNDLTDIERDTNSNYKKPRFFAAEGGAITLTGSPVAPPGHPETDAGQLDNQLASHLRIYDLLRPRITNLLVRSHFIKIETAVDDYLGYFVKRDAAERTRRWSLWRAIMNQMAAETRAAGMKLVVLVSPVRTQADPKARARLEKIYGYREEELNLEEPEEEISRWGREAGVPVALALPKMREAVAAGPSPYFRFDLHPNAHGHEVLFHTVEPFVTAGMPAPPGVGPGVTATATTKDENGTR